MRRIHRGGGGEGEAGTGGGPGDSSHPQPPSDGRQGLFRTNWKAPLRPAATATPHPKRETQAERMKAAAQGELDKSQEISFT